MRILDNIGLVQDPFHLGAVILDKLIGDLKSKLPFLAKKKADDDDLDEEIEGEEGTETETEVSSEDDDEKTNVSRSPVKDEDNSFAGKIKAKLNSFKKKKTSDEILEDAIAEDDEAPVKEKKKPNYIVIIGALGLMAFIFLSDFGEETPAPTNPEAMLKKRPKKQPPKPAETKPTETTSTDTTATTATTETPTDTTKVTEPTTPTDTTTTTAETPATTTTESPVDTTVTTPTETTPAETTPTETTTPETTTTESTVTTSPEDTTTTTTTTTVSPDDNATTDSVNGEETKGSEDNLTEQILKDLENQAQGTQKEKPVKTEYVTPPNYENVGRGLVYNCTGKHWACIDGPSYKTCEENASSIKFLKKNSECYPFNVYETQSGCEKMQNRMVSSSAKTEFCSGN